MYPRCFQYDEDTSSKAIHNGLAADADCPPVVFNMTKIQVRKQFTTVALFLCLLISCFQYDEDTSSKAIHNQSLHLRCISRLFSIWRRYKFESNSQRLHLSKNFLTGCFQYDEDTSSKAIHNERLAWVMLLSVVFNMTKIQVRKQFTTLL